MAVLESNVTSPPRENMKKAPKNDKKHTKKVLVVAQELKLARVLAGNNKTARDRALKSLKKWFENRSQALPFTEDDFLRLWKGLFYSMWMSDKPLIQEECAENIASLVHSLPSQSAILFYKCSLKTLMNEWFGIDQLRLDKFLMFVRRLLRQALFTLKNCNWSKDTTNIFCQSLEETILDPQTQKPIGLLLHFIEIYLEELAKVSDGQLAPHLTTNFLKPFIRFLASSDDLRVLDHIRKHIFIYLIRQSDLGLDYEEKYKVWKSLGFPGSIDSVKKIEVDDEDVVDEAEEEKVYDPRAGRVNVDLPQIRFSSKSIAKELESCKFDKSTNSKSRKCIKEMVEHFKKLASGIYPLGVKKVKLADDSYDTNVRKAVNRLVKFEKKIIGKKKRKSEEIELRGGKKIKLDSDFREKLANDFTNGQILKEDNEFKRKLKEKMTKKRRFDMPEIVAKKKKKNKAVMEIESVFKRNSGTWLVTKVAEEPKKESKERLWVSQKWEESNDEAMNKIEKKLKKGRLSLPENLLQNPFSSSTPAKKVKINVKLNTSQEIQEHHLQILSSPAIPYDANKKPSKPLLKNSFRSPINPFNL